MSPRAERAGSRLRRGPEQIRAAAGLLGVDEQLDLAGLRRKNHPSPSGWLSHQCPNYDEHAHGDRNFSASSNVESGQWVCHGCGARGRWPGFGSAAKGSGGNARREVPDIEPPEPYERAPGESAEYTYRDETGEHVASVQVDRWVELGPNDEELHRKQIFVTHPRNDGPGWVRGWGSLDNVPLYRSPEVLEAVGRGDPVYVVEGEKDADRLWEEGAAATTSPFGAGKFSKVTNAHILRGAQVRVVADRDRAGLRHALDVRDRLEGAAALVEVLLPAVGKEVACASEVEVGGPVDVHRRAAGELGLG